MPSATSAFDPPPIPLASFHFSIFLNFCLYFLTFLDRNPNSSLPLSLFPSAATHSQRPSSQEPQKTQRL